MVLLVQRPQSLVPDLHRLTVACRVTRRQRYPRKPELPKASRRDLVGSRFLPGPEPVQVVGPCLRHLSLLGQERGSVVGLPFVSLTAWAS